MVDNPWGYKATKRVVFDGCLSVVRFASCVNLNGGEKTLFSAALVESYSYKADPMRDTGLISPFCWIIGDLSKMRNVLKGSRIRRPTDWKRIKTHRIGLNVYMLGNCMWASKH